jgi:hypothetical protein
MIWRKKLLGLPGFGASDTAEDLAPDLAAGELLMALILDGCLLC